MPQATSVTQEAFIPLSAPVRPSTSGQPDIEKNSVKSNSSAHQGGFNRVLDKARQGHSEAAEEEAARWETTTDGNDLPLPSEQLPQQTDVILTLKSDHIANRDLSDVVAMPLLADGFAVASLTRAIRDVGADTGHLKKNGPPVLLARLEASVSAKGDTGNKLAMKLGNPEFSAKTATEPVHKTEASENILVRLQSVELKSLQAARIELAVPMKVASPNWGESMAGRISMMVNQRFSHARIHINPPELGPIEVRVNINHEQASVQFISHSPQVRDALEQSIPRLREMLETAGFSLADADVKDQSSHQGSSARHDPADSDITDRDIAEPVTRRISVGLIDHYV